MQVQKDSVREGIVSAALDEFYSRGCLNASMRTIASNAGITVGNIYSYFDSKDSLIIALLSPTAQKLRELIGLDIGSDIIMTGRGLAQMAGRLTDIFLSERLQFLILMDKAEGSTFSGVKNELRECARSRICAELGLRTRGSSHDLPLADSLAAAVIEGLLTVFRRFDGSREQLERLILEFLNVLFGDITIRMGGVSVG